MRVPNSEGLVFREETSPLADLTIFGSDDTRIVPADAQALVVRGFEGFKVLMPNPTPVDDVREFLLAAADALRPMAREAR